MTPLERITRDRLIREGLRVGTTFENRVMLRLHTWGLLPGCHCQHPVDRYRLDFAWPELMIALEVDGPHHARPDVACLDVLRDGLLRSKGWLVLRIDDASEMEPQLERVSRVLRGEAEWLRLPLLESI